MNITKSGPRNDIEMSITDALSLVRELAIHVEHVHVVGGSSLFKVPIVRKSKLDKPIPETLRIIIHES